MVEAPPTDAQLDMLREVFALSEKHGFAPTIRELGLALGIRSTNGVKDHLKALKRRELIEWAPNKARTLRVTQRGRDVLLGRAA